MTTALARARSGLSRLHPVVAGAAGYGLVALVVHDVGALVAAGIGLALVEVVLRRRSSLTRPGWRPSHVVELVIGAALVRRDGIVRPLVGLVIGGALAVGLGLLGLVVIVGAAHGLAVLAGVACAALVAIGHRRERAVAHR